jgi:hypothetical protein
LRARLAEQELHRNSTLFEAGLRREVQHVYRVLPWATRIIQTRSKATFARIATFRNSLWLVAIFHLGGSHPILHVIWSDDVCAGVI